MFVLKFETQSSYFILKKKREVDFELAFKKIAF